MKNYGYNLPEVENTQLLIYFIAFLLLILSLLFSTKIYNVIPAHPHSFPISY